MKKAMLFTAIAALLSACGDSSSERSDIIADSPTPSASPVASADPLATPSATATPGTTALPSASPLPSTAPTATPVVLPTPTPLPDFGNKGACLLPVSPQATTAVSSGAACIQCTVTNAEAVTTATRDDVAEIAVSLGIVPEGGFSDLSLQVNLLLEQDPTAEPGAAGGLVADKPGFLISFPDTTLLSAGVAPTITVDTLLGDALVNTSNYGFGFFDQLALGLVGVDINNAQVYLPVDATSSYDAVRLSITGGLASALLNLNVHSACIAGVAGSISGDF